MGRGTWRSWISLLAALPLAACAQQADDSPAARLGSSDDDPRIESILNGLVPLTESAEPQWERRATLADRMDHYRVPGLGVAVFDGFEVVWSKGFGLVKAGSEERVTAETLFHAGSIAKSLSAAAALALVEEGMLDLDRDLNEPLRSWRIPESDLTHDEKVTLRRLLSHSAGIQDGFTDRSSADEVPDYFTPAGEELGVTLQELLDAAPGVDVDGPTRVTAVPGSRYRYANADYAILELVVRDVTGERYPDFMARKVLAPLGMSSSTFEQPIPPDLRARAAVEHDLRGRPIRGDRLHSPMLAAGGLWTTPSDLARFALEVMRAHGGESGTLLSQAMAQQMLSRQIDIPENPLAEAAGLGFALAGEGDGYYFVHTGGTWGSTSILWAYPVTGQGTVIMTNSASGSFLRIELLLAIALEYGWELGE